MVPCHDGANPEATATALEHGWLHTGDIGYLDADSFWIVDRMKDMVFLVGMSAGDEEVLIRLFLCLLVHYCWV